MRLRGLYIGPLLSIILVVMTTSSALAQTVPLVIESSPMQPSVVLGRPMLTWWDVKIRGSSLMVGKFQFVIKSEDHVLATVQTEELTLSGPEQRIRVLLPPIDSVMPLDQLFVDISFDGKRYSGKLSQQILRLPFSSKKVFVALVGETRTVRKKSAERAKLLDQLKFEMVMPEQVPTRRVDEDHEYVKTFFASIDATDFPTEALAYCGYDLVVLMGDDFRALRKPQLQGLLDWIKAGGALYVEPYGTLDSFHIDFLRNLTAESRDNLVIQVDSTGILPKDTIPHGQGAYAVSCGIGGAVLRTAGHGAEWNISPQDWQSLAGTLWKFRSQPLAARSIQRPNDPFVQQGFELPGDPWGFALARFYRFRLPQSDLLDRLLPEGIQMVPLWLLASILFAFVVLIGPVDYYLLGMWRARKLTWVTFPLATIAVTILTVRVTNSYMTTAETRRAAVVCDVGAKGELVRTNRFELMFVASTRRVTTEIEKGLFLPLRINSANDMQFSAGAFRNYGGYQNNWSNNRPGVNYAVDANREKTELQTQGRIPSQYEIRQDLVKWTPQLNRVLNIPGNISPPTIDWRTFHLGRNEADAIRHQQVPLSLKAQALQQFGRIAMVACFCSQNGWAYDRSANWFSARSRIRDQFYNRPQINLYAYDQTQLIIPPHEAELLRWIFAASVANPSPGNFSLTSRTVPSGNADCSDLPLLDSTDNNTWLLVVVVPTQDDFIIYRKLMMFDD